MTAAVAKNIVLIVHYFPPINSSGAKRMEAMAKYFARSGRSVTVITTAKTSGDGEFTERFPEGVRVLELDWLGREAKSVASTPYMLPHNAGGQKRLTRRFKDLVMRWLGQLPDPRLPFAFSFAKPVLNPAVHSALLRADIVVATCPPWPPLLAAVFARARFKKPIILDYRDQFSLCHEMPGGTLAKAIELRVDRFLARRADALVAISRPMGEYYSHFNPTTAVILNGYDPEALDDAKRLAHWVPRAKGAPLTIRYLGMVSEGRIPRGLLEALDAFQAAGQLGDGSLTFEYYGEAHPMQQYLDANHPRLAGFFAFFPRVSYARSLELAVTADHLLFCENSIPPRPGEGQSAQGILTTKLFEYLASGRPVLAHIRPDTLAGSFIIKASNDHFVSDKRADFEALLSSNGFWHPGSVPEEPFVRGLSRAAQAVDYLRVIDSVVSGSQIPSELLLNAA